MAPELILASRSPQRRAILEQLGVSFAVEVPDVEELAEGEPRELVLENARRKAAAVAGQHAAAAARGLGDGVAGGAAAGLGDTRAGDAVAPSRVLGVDTAVVLDGQVYGKPPDIAAARQVLSALSGRRHEVLSGIVLRSGTDERVDVAVTRVRFRHLGAADINWYVRSGEWRERAGGYAIQGLGAALVEEIEGDYSNVVGLPIPALVRLAPDLFR